MFNANKCNIKYIFLHTFIIFLGFNSADVLQLHLLDNLQSADWMNEWNKNNQTTLLRRPLYNSRGKTEVNETKKTSQVISWDIYKNSDVVLD